MSENTASKDQSATQPKDAAACCSTEEKKTCCEPSAKATCCPPVDPKEGKGSGCGCR